MTIMTEAYFNESYDTSSLADHIVDDVPTIQADYLVDKLSTLDLDIRAYRN